MDHRAERTAKEQETEPVRATLVFMPFLSGSWREWQPVMDRLPRFACVGLDLPGFGDASGIPGYSVTEMAEYVEREVAALAPERYVLVGHSMAGKVSMVVASRAAVDGLAGLVLVASSPPSPEPMPEKKRAEMLKDLGSPQPEFKEHAEAFIRDNLAAPLSGPVFESAVADVLRMNLAAWRAWLEGGSREDWADRVSELRVPALVVAGEKDENLGAEAQMLLTLPHLPAGRLKVVHGAKHLVPVEQPEALAAMIAGFVDGLTGGNAPVPDPAYSALIASGRVSSATRGALRGREGDRTDYLPAVLSSSEMTTLAALAECIVPLEGRRLDFAQRLDRQLAEGKGKGWRFAALPPDPLAWKLALQCVEDYCKLRFDKPMPALTAEQQETVLKAAAAGELEPRLIDRALHFLREPKDTPGQPALNGEQMQHWFEDLRAELTTIYVSHPATLAEMGYSGIADGSDSDHLTGFVQLGLGARESWEPEAHSKGQA